MRQKRRGFNTIRDLHQARLSAGERHLADFLEAAQKGLGIPPATLAFLRVASWRLLSGEDPTTALELNKKPGRREVPVSTCDQVARAIWGERYFGATYEEAVEVVGHRYGLVRNTVTSYFARSERTGGIPPQKRSDQAVYPVNPIERQRYLEGRLKTP